MNIRLIVLILCILLLVSCSRKAKPIEDVTIITSDKMILSATYFPADSNKGLIVLHQLNSDRHSYDEFAKQAVKNNYSVVAVDLRGHGESDRRWTEFTEADFIGMEKDAYAAKNYLRSKGIGEIYVIGSSIGANTAINFASHNEDISKAVALSPSFNYKGISTRETILNFNKKLMIIVSNGDSQSYNDSQIIARLVNAEIFVLNSDAHGTAMLSSQVENTIFEWLGQ